ncbi:MAG: hypothetical protein E7421_03250 [Ruminococcaceae bacterium]|nr:hypothetical protein [Oscillospiraceae bacterium]
MKNKVLAILMSAVVAFGLWMYVITVVSPESEKTYYDIPVVMQNKNILSERGLIIVSEEPNVTLALKSDRTILNDLNESNINVMINLANIEKPGVHNLTYDISYPGNIPHNEVSVQSSSTDLIEVKVENRIRKPVPVVIDYGETTVPEGYISDVENAQMDFTTIEISGPESTVSQITQAKIQVDLTGQTNTVAGEYQYALCNAQGEPVDAKLITANAEKVNLMIKVQKVKEVALLLDIISGGGATQQNTTITMDTKQIQVSGRDALLEDLDSITVGVIDLGEIKEDQTLTFPITLPEDVTNQTGVEQVTVEIKLPKLKTKILKVTNITAANVPADLQVEIITKALQITVRGPEAQIKNIKETDVSVVINLAEAQAGTVTMKGEVVVADGFADVGAMGTYPVSANLRNG